MHLCDVMWWRRFGTPRCMQHVVRNLSDTSLYGTCPTPPCMQHVGHLVVCNIRVYVFMWYHFIQRLRMIWLFVWVGKRPLVYSATHCNTHCNAHYNTHCNTLQQSTTLCNAQCIVVRETEASIIANAAYVAVCCRVLQCVLQCVAEHDRVSQCWWALQVVDICHAYEWFLSHISMSHVTHINEIELCHTYDRAISHV